MGLHPCQKCGACCAYFRVSFYWREAEPNDQQNPVPKELCEDSDDQHRTMKGTSGKHKLKCVALSGEIGKYVACTIYENRSSTCRNFSASYENGYQNIRCDQARAKHGLAPLCKQDWKDFLQDSSNILTLT